MIVHHGTSNENFLEILKTGIIIPGFNIWAGIRRRQVYFTSNMKYAKMYATIKSDEKSGVVITLDIDESEFIEYKLLFGEININYIKEWFYNDARNNRFFVSFHRNNKIPEPEDFESIIFQDYTISDKEKLETLNQISSVEVTTDKEMKIENMLSWIKV